MVSRDVLCSGCGRRLAMSPNRLPGFLYCDLPEKGLLCGEEMAAGTHEERDAIVAELSMHAPHRVVGEGFGVTRQRVQQIIAARRGA